MSVELSVRPDAPELAHIDPITIIMSAVNATDVEDRVEAAHWAVELFLEMADGEAADNAHMQAPLMAALLAFLKDHEPRVRGAIAVGLLQSEHAPRSIMVQLMSDEPIIATAVAQHAQVLADCDLARQAQTDAKLAHAIAQRDQLSSKILTSLVAHGDREVALTLLARTDIEISANLLAQIYDRFDQDDEIKDALLAHDELPGLLRLTMCWTRLDRYFGVVEGKAPANDPLRKQWRAERENVTARLVDQAAPKAQIEMITHLAHNNQLTPRLMMRALVCGYFGFLEVALVHLAKLPPKRVAELFMRAPQAGLVAIYKKCGTSDAFAQMMAYATHEARQIDLEFEARGRFMLVNACLTWLDQHHADESFQPVYQFLSELSIDLARAAVDEVHQPLKAPLAIAGPETASLAA